MKSWLNKSNKIGFSTHFLELALKNKFNNAIGRVNKRQEPYYRMLVEKLLEALIKKYKDRFYSFVVFGSVARAEARGESDIDFAFSDRFTA